jgi:hypothetical protein
MHPEQLMDLAREVWLSKSKKLAAKFSRVKGVCFIEDIVRSSQNQGDYLLL